MKNKTHMRRLFATKKLIVIISLLLVMLLLIGAMTYAWFRNIIQVQGAMMNTGKFQYEFAGYHTDNNGELKTDFANSTQVETDTFNKDTGEGFSPIPTTETLTASSGCSTIVTTRSSGNLYFVVHKLENSVDLEVSIKLAAELNDLDAVGGFWYKIYEVSGDSTDKNDPIYSSDNVLDAIESNVLNENLGINNTSVKTEENFVNIRTEIRTEELSDNDYWCFRLSYGQKPNATLGAYSTGEGVAIRAELCVAQVGGLEGMETQKVIPVKTAAQLEAALTTYTADAVIRVQGDITYDHGDMILNRPVSLEIVGGTLTIKGNLRFVYAFEGKFCVNTSQNGTLKVVRMDDAPMGGNIYADIPHSSIEFAGMNMDSHQDVIVQGDLSVDASYERGMIVTKAKICHLNGTLEPIWLRNSTCIDIDRFTEVGEIRVDMSSAPYRVKILNNGTIGRIDLLQMSTEGPSKGYPEPRIYIENRSTISAPIRLPIWATKYLPADENNGVETGNTDIWYFPGAGDTLIESGTGTVYTTADVRTQPMASLVDRTNNSDPTAITVHYMTIKDDPNTESLGAILNNANAIKPESERIAALDSIASMRIISYGGKVLTEEDYRFIRENMPSLKELDLGDAASENRTFPDGALAGLMQLSKVTLPANDQEWGSAPFDQTAIDEIYVPASVLTINSETALTHSFRNAMCPNNYISYIHVAQSIKTLELPEPSYIFVSNESALSLYNTSNKKVFEEATRFQRPEGDFFVRLLGDSCEFATYVGTNPEWWKNVFEYKTIENGVDSSCIELDMSSINLGVKYNLVGIDPYAFYNKFTDEDVTSTFVLCLGNNVEEIGECAFWNSTKLLAVYGEGVTYCGNQAFYNCSLLNKLILPSLHTIGPKSSVIIQNCAALKWLETGVINRENNTSEATALLSGTNALSFYMIHAVGNEGSQVLTIPAIRTEAAKDASYMRVLMPDVMASHYSTNDTTKIACISLSGMSTEQLQIYPSIPEDDHVSLPRFIYGNRDGQNVLFTCMDTKLAVSEVFDAPFFDTIHVIGNSAYRFTSIYSEEGEDNVLTIPARVTEIEARAFQGSNKLYHTLQLNQVEIVAEKAFQNNKMLFVYGNEVTTIGYHAFMYAQMHYVELRALRTTLPQPDKTEDSEYEWGYYFRGCPNLRIAFFGPMDRLDDYMFYGSGSVRVIFIDSTDRATSNTKLPTSVSLPSSAVVFNAGRTKLMGIEEREHLLDGFDNLMYVDFQAQEITLSASGYGTVTGEISLPQNVVQRKTSDNTLKFVKSMVPKISDKNYKTPEMVYQTNEFISFLGQSHIKYTLDYQEGYTNAGLITEIGGSAYAGVSFVGCEYLTIGDNVRTLGDSAFAGCAAAYVDLNNVTTLMRYCFSGAKMTGINAPKVKTMQCGTFANITTLKSIELPAFERITGNENNGAFHTSKIETVVFGRNTADLGLWMFYQCTALKEVTIQSTTVPSGSRTFSIGNNTNIATNINLYVRESAGYFTNEATTHWNYLSRDCVAYFDNIYVDETNQLEYYWDVTSETAKTAEIILIRALENVSLVDNTLRIPSTVEKAITVGEEGSTSTYMQTYVITLVNEKALLAIKSLSYTYLELPYAMEILEFDQDCLPPSLTGFSITQNSDPDYSYHFKVQDGVLYNENLSVLLLYPSGKTDKEFVVPASVTSLAAVAFSNAMHLEKLTVSGTLTIMDRAFAYAGSLAEIHFTQTTPSLFIGHDIFEGCGNIQSIYVPNEASLSAYAKNVIYERKIISYFKVSTATPPATE